MDEFIAGYGKQINVTVFNDRSIQVEDFGRGVPLDWNEKEQRYNWELVYCELYAGGKYNNDSNGAYEMSQGLNGLGACATQYASEFMEVTAYSKGTKYSIAFKAGYPVGELKKEPCAKTRTGTVQRWKPDREVFTDVNIPRSYFHDVMKLQSVVNGGLKLVLKWQEQNGSFETEEFYIKSPEEMTSLFEYVPQAIENTEKIAKRCNVDFDFGTRHLPAYAVPDGKDAFEYLRELCQSGLEKRYSPVSDELQKRLDYELGVIKSMGFVDYFLIVWDFIHFAKNNGVMVGPGRGSAAGSIVAYSLGITTVDPIKYGLIFERFLNPERVSMPDIDIDFAPNGRQKMPPNPLDLPPSHSHQQFRPYYTVQ